MARIFLVEDNALMRENLELYFDHVPDIDLVGMAASGEEALEALEGADAHVVLVDYSLPKMNGVELVRRIKERWPEQRVLIVSGHDEASYGSRAREARADGYVMKGDAMAIVDAAVHVSRGGRYFDGEAYPEEGPDPAA